MRIVIVKKGATKQSFGPHCQGFPGEPLCPWMVGVPPVSTK
jgi:hypothetical protein